MASSGWRAGIETSLRRLAASRRSFLAFGLLAIGGACTTTQAPQSVPATAAAEPAVAAEPPAPTEPAAAPSAGARGLPLTAYAPGVDLPEGPGRDILYAECLSCHELTALALFKGFYTRDSWRALVVGMVANGAEVDDAELEVLSDYLAQHFGVGSP